MGQPRNRQEAEMLGLPAWQIDQMFPQNEAPNTGLLAPEQPGLLAKQPGFWEGGDKFKTRDGIAGLLAVISEVADRQSGRSGGAVEMLAGGRLSAIDQARKAAEQQARMQEMEQAYRNAGVDPAKARLAAMGGAKYGDIATKPPAMQQNYEFYKGLPDEEKRGFEQYQSVVNPKWIMGPDGRPYPQPAQNMGPQPGAVEDGFRFKGGDAANPNNWEPVDNVGGQYLPIPRFGGER